MADAISADDRLARQAMEAFRRSQRPDGLINADAPTVKSNVIPAFSIYYLLVVHDHMMYFGDKALAKRHLPAIDGILGFLTGIFRNRALWGKVAARSCVTAIGRLLTGLVCGIPVYRLQPERVAVRLQWKAYFTWMACKKLLSWLNLQAEPIPLRSTGSGQEHFRMQSVPIAWGSIRAQHWFRMGPALKNIRYTARYLPF